MTDSRLLNSAKQLFERNEQRLVLALAESERLVRDNEAKLADLERYRAAYLHDFDQRAGDGMNAGQACTYQMFIARVAQAISEQQVLLERSRVQHAEELRKWRSAARRSAALNRILARRERAAHLHAEKTEQATSDAHAQRAWTLKGARRGH